MLHGQAGDGDAQGDAGGDRPRDPVRPARLRLRDHGLAAREGLLRHRRGDRLRPADQDRAARPRRRGEGPLREGAAAQGVLPQRRRDRTTSKSSGGPGASSQNDSNSSAKEDSDMVPSGSRPSPDRSSRRSSTGSTRHASRPFPSRTAPPRGASSATSCTTAAHATATPLSRCRGLRRPVGAGRRRRHADARHRRGGPGRVRRDLRCTTTRQAVDRQGARPPDQGRSTSAERETSRNR